MKLIKYFLVFTLLLGLYSCNDDNNIPINENTINDDPVSNFAENFGNITTARFMGRVISEEGNPISGVTVSIGTSTTLTDGNGVFSIEQASVYEKFAYIRATKEGFIDGSRALVPSSGVNQVTIMLLDFDVVETINSGEVSTVSLSNNTEIVFDGNFVDNTGSTYSGNVNVVLKYLSTDDENMDLQMPGMLFAQNENGDPRVLETYGMVAVELRGSSGEELQLAEGSLAQITFPLASNISNPPNSIPLWYFDEENGYWIEEGEATLQGNTYVGDVSHFTFWNWDFQYPAVTICITLQDEEGNVLGNTPLDLYSPALNSTGTYGYTNSAGVECGLVPQDDELTLVVPNYGCLGDDFTTQIGPFSTDQDVTVTVTDGTALTTNLTATLNDCDGNPITNGYIQLYYNNTSNIIPIENGMLDLTIAYCGTDTSFTAQVMDLNNNQTTDVTTGNFTEPTTDLGTQMSCVDLTDSDADGVLDIHEDVNGDNNLDNDDTDNDGIPNYLDEDDDGDGINTADEDYDNDGDPINDDSDGDQIPDYLDEIDVLVYDIEFPIDGCPPNNFVDFDQVIASQLSGLINNTYQFFETQADADAGTNPLSSPYNFDIVTTPTLFFKATNTVSGQSAVGTLYLYEVYMDSDQDGLTDCEEITGIDYPFGSNCYPNGNITDPNDPDSDDDGYDDCIENLNGTDPNDPNSFPDTTDSDGDSVLDSQEAIDGTDPNDVCDYNQANFNVNNVSNNWHNADCDGDGSSNECEFFSGYDIFDPCDYHPTCRFNTITAEWNALDCDGDGVSNGDEETNGTDPLDPTDN